MNVEILIREAGNEFIPVGEAMIVYVVEYNNEFAVSGNTHSVDGVFSTRELAQAYIEGCNNTWVGDHAKYLEIIPYEVDKTV